ncbi:MAG TPA: hypothetical protein VGM67_11190 [Gemmatimonadaceae bacterium]|jgi:hypothetical protein
MTEDARLNDALAADLKAARDHIVKAKALLDPRKKDQQAAWGEIDQAQAHLESAATVLL